MTYGSSDPGDGDAFADAITDSMTADDDADWGYTSSDDASSQVDSDVDITPGGDD